MSQNGDELKFRRAYSDRVEFKSFNEKTPEIYSNSRFSLIRELATEAAPAVTDIKSAASVRELLSVTPKKEKEEREVQTRVALSTSAAVQKNRASSLKSFLSKNTEGMQHEKISPLTDAPPSIANTSPPKEEVNAVSSAAPANSSAPADQETKTKSKTETSVIDESYVAKKNTKHFSSLFRSSVASEFRGRKTESLQDLYKRLMKE